MKKRLSFVFIPSFLEPQKLPPYKKLDDLWEQRYQEIVQFEETLVRHGTGILKFFLHVSKDEQKKRLLERMRVPEKQWKFNERDLVERKLWSEYEAAYEAMLPATSTKNAPWFVIPADDKWYPSCGCRYHRRIPGVPRSCLSCGQRRSAIALRATCTTT